MVTYYTIAFFSGLAVMGIELTASRLIAPYFGTSMFVWTNVIAVILAALSLGYYLGGRMSEQAPRLPVLLRIITVAGLLVAVIPFVVRPIALRFSFDFGLFSSASLFVVIVSFLLTLALFFIPMVLLGMTSPFLIKIVSLKRQDVGQVAGQIFAVGTVGSIIGTFLPALIFIPWIGTKYTLLAFAGLLIGIGLIGLLPRRLFVMIPLLGVPFGFLDQSLKPAPYVIHETESAYQYVQVAEVDKMRYLIYNEGGGVQSVYHPDKIFYGGYYFDVAALLPALGDAKNVMIIGVAGGTIPRAMHSLYGSDPAFHIDGIEIDPQVIRLARQYFDIDQPSLTITNADGRAAVVFGSRSYDLLFIDAYANQLYIPFHLTTQEFFTLAAARLNPGGILAINVNALGDDSLLLRSITNTIASVFPAVYRIHIGESWNYIVIAAKTPVDFSRLVDYEFPIAEFQTLAESIPDGVREISFDPSIPILTDDWAPVEHMTDAMIWTALKERL